MPYHLVLSLLAGSEEGGVQAGAERGVQEGDEEDPLRGAVRDLPEVQARAQGGRKGVQNSNFPLRSGGYLQGLRFIINFDLNVRKFEERFNRILPILGKVPGLQGFLLPTY